MPPLNGLQHSSSTQRTLKLQPPQQQQQQQSQNDRKSLNKAGGGRSSASSSKIGKLLTLKQKQSSQLAPVANNTLQLKNQQDYHHQNQAPLQQPCPPTASDSVLHEQQDESGSGIFLGCQSTIRNENSVLSSS